MSLNQRLVTGSPIKRPNRPLIIPELPNRTFLHFYVYAYAKKKNIEHLRFLFISAREKLTQMLLDLHVGIREITKILKRINIKKQKYQLRRRKWSLREEEEL